MDVTEAFLNDPYDWDGPKRPHVCATEADMDGALTMQILKRISGGLPVLFADVRHYHATEDVWDLCNSGQHATWFAARSDDPAENLRHVHLYPEGFYFPAGGASVHHLAAEGRSRSLGSHATPTAATGCMCCAVPWSSSRPEMNERLMHASDLRVATRLRPAATHCRRGSRRATARTTSTPSRASTWRSCGRPAD